MNEFNSTYNDQNIGNENLSAFFSRFSVGGCIININNLGFSRLTLNKIVSKENAQKTPT